MTTENTSKSLYQRIKGSKLLAIGIVWATFALDPLLFSAVVPIIPKYIHNSNIKTDTLSFSNESTALNTVTNESMKCGQSKTNHAAENWLIGGFLATKYGVQIIANIFAGPLIDKIGFDLPLFCGYIIIMLSSLGFALSPDLVTMFIARGFQGIGSSFVSVAGLTLIAEMFNDYNERSKMFSLAVCGISSGLLVGPTYGAVLYQFGGQAAPFIGTAIMAVVFASLQLLLRLPKVKRKDNSKTKSFSDFRVFADWQIWMTSLSMTLGNVGQAFLQGVLPIQMIRKICAEQWMLGVVFLPIDGGYLIGTVIYGWMRSCFGTMNLITLSQILSGVVFIAYPFCNEPWQFFCPGFVIGLSAAILNAAMYQATAYLVDTRLDGSHYGGAYAITDLSFCFAYGAGPLIAGFLVPFISFDGTMYVATTATILALIPTCILRKAIDADLNPLQDETQLLRDSNTK